MRFSVAVLGLLFLLLLPRHEIVADDLPEYWQLQRSRINVLGDSACKGAEGDFLQVVELAERQNNPVAKHELAWILIKPFCRKYGRRSYEVPGLVEEAARQSYPISQFYHGLAILDSAGATEVERQNGLCWIYRGIQGGYGNAAAFLAKSYLLGQTVGFEPKLSLGFFKVAREEGADGEEMLLLNEVYSNAFISHEENEKFLADRLAECDEQLG